MDLRLTSVRCRSNVDRERLEALFEALGASVTTTGGCVVGDVGNATIVHDRRDETSGIDRLELTGGLRMGDRHHTASGLEVTVTGGPHRDETDDEPVRLDHLAIGVTDLDSAEVRWATITGAAPEPMRVHPASNGSFTATRFVLGPQMIELVSPVPGVDSPIARRIARHVDGPVTLALPVGDLPGAIDRLATIGVGVMRTGHRAMLQPRDPGGVLVQLTPRLEH